MMLKKQSTQWARLKLLLFVPLAVVLLQAFARTEIIRTEESLIDSEVTTIFGEIQQLEEKPEVQQQEKGFIQQKPVSVLKNDTLQVSQPKNRIAGKSNNIIVKGLPESIQKIIIRGDTVIIIDDKNEQVLIGDSIEIDFDNNRFSSFDPKYKISKDLIKHMENFESNFPDTYKFTYPDSVYFNRLLHSDSLFTNRFTFSDSTAINKWFQENSNSIEAMKNQYGINSLSQLSQNQSEYSKQIEQQRIELRKKYEQQIKEFRKQSEQRRKELQQQSEERRKELQQQSEQRRKELQQQSEKLRNELQKQSEERRKELQQQSEKLRNELQKQSEERRKEMQQQYEQRRKEFQQQSEKLRNELQKQSEITYK